MAQMHQLKLQNELLSKLFLLPGYEYTSMKHSLANYLRTIGDTNLTYLTLIPGTSFLVIAWFLSSSRKILGEFILNYPTKNTLPKLFANSFGNIFVPDGNNFLGVAPANQTQKGAETKSS